MQVDLFSRKRSVIILTTSILIAAIALSSFVYLNLRGNYEGNPQSITFGNLPLESSGLIYVAEKQGFFKQNGLNLIVKDYDTGLSSVNALLKGDVDIAGASEYPIVRAAFQNESVKTIAVINKSQLEYIIARKDHGIENVSDLRGKTIALPKGTIAEFYLARLLSFESINTSDVTLLNMTLAQSLEALLNGTVDALVNWQPYTNIVESNLGNNAVSWSVQSSQQSFGVMICRNDWITQNPELVKHFLRALNQAEEYVHNDPAGAKEIVKKQMNFSDEHTETVWRQNQFSLSLDQSLVIALENEARWMIANNITNLPRCQIS